MPDEPIKKEEEIFIPVTGKDVPLHSIGYPAEYYNAMIEENKTQKQANEDQKQESNAQLAAKKIIIEVISNYNTEKDIDDILTELNIDGKSPEAEDIRKTWEEVSVVVKDKEAQQKEVDSLTETLGKIKNPNGDNYKETEKSLLEAKKKLVEKIETVNKTKQRPQVEADRINKDIIVAEANIVAAQANIDSASAEENIISNNQNTILQNRAYYNEEYGKSDYIQQLIEEIKNEGILDTAAASHKASTASQMANKLMPSIIKAQEKGEYSCIYQTLTKLQIHILFIFGYVVSTIPSKTDKSGKLTKKDEEGVDYVATWSHLISDGGDMK